ncbi:MAG: serine O-acetyltransferase EpsC [Luteibaculaceae bacterium]
MSKEARIALTQWIENASEEILSHEFNPEKQVESLFALSSLTEQKILPSSAVKQEIVKAFKQLPGLLKNDAAFFLDSDPAAESLLEIELSYPGFLALKVHRIAHVLYQYEVPLIPRFCAEWAHSKTGIDIHPGASIASPVFIDHGTGVVIGETTKIGQYVKIFQGVTLGALAVSRDKRFEKRHPTVEDHVVLYAGCVILGGDTTIGHNTVVGGNVWLTKSVAPFSVVQHKPEIIISDSKALQHVINFSI